MALKLMKSYLKDRKQYVEVVGKDGVIRTEVVINEMGVPQGSILGPLLFLLYVAYINRILKYGAAVDFVDDKTVIFKDLSMSQLILQAEEDLKNLSWIFKAMNLNFNIIKSVCMLFCKKFEFQEILCGEDQLSRVKLVKLLGLYIQEDLSWQEQIKTVVKKVGSYGYAMKKLKNILSRKDLLSVYYAFIHSTIKYGIIFWGGANVTEVLILQKKILRNVYSLDQRSSCRNLFEEAEILTVVYSVHSGMYSFCEQK